MKPDKDNTRCMATTGMPTTTMGMMQQAAPGTMFGMQQTMPGMAPGMAPGMMPGMAPGMMPGMMPGMTTGTGGTDLESRVSTLERQMRRLETRVSRLETPYPAGQTSSYQTSMPQTGYQTAQQAGEYPYSYQTPMQMM